MKRRTRILMLGVGLALPVVAGAAFLGEAGERPAIELAVGGASPRLAGPTLRVLTLNMAHGRSDGRHQALQSTAALRGHLETIATTLRREAPDVVALQEADGPSVWTGGFDHVAHVAQGAGFPFAARGEHVVGAGLRYGTALLSQRPLGAARSVGFTASPPTLRKGFLVAAVEVPGLGSVDVVSVHLDFSRASVRADQVRALATVLQRRDRPRVVMGDFNAGWDEASTVPWLADALDLRAWQPHTTEATFPTFGRRIDWILYSPTLAPVSHRVLSDVLSDHRAVVATFRVAD